MLDEYTSTYQVEVLQSRNWMPWQRRMLAVLRHIRLDKHIANENVPLTGVAKEGQPTEKVEAQKKWPGSESKRSSGDAEIIHISG